MGGSRKYPYPTTGGISLSSPPPPPWIFHIYKELVTHPPLPPPPHHSGISTKWDKPPPAPLEKFILTKMDCQSKEDAICSYAMVFWFVSLKGA